MSDTLILSLAPPDHAQVLRLDLSFFVSLSLLRISILRWGWVFLERTRILSGIQFTTHVIESFVVETK